MEHSVATKAARYRLLFVQPDPEGGERVCVGLLFEEPGRRPEIVYDRTLAKLHCLAPAADPSLVRFFLEDLKHTLRSSKNPEYVLHTAEPQVTTSEYRSVVSPLTDAKKTTLLERFALREGPKAEATVKRLRRHPHTGIQHFVERVAAPLQLRIRQKVRVHEVLGKPVPNVDPVAFGITTESNVVLIDGLDLRALTPKRSVGEVNRVVHAFWQWGRLHEVQPLFRMQDLQRIGIILNGEIPKGKNVRRYLDAHDYAMDQFRKEADLTVESSSDSDKRTFEEVLRRVSLQMDR